MRKHVRVCCCGTIHFVNEDIIDAAIVEDKNIIFICGQCGRATVVGADRILNEYKEKEDDPDYAFDMYSFKLERNCNSKGMETETIINEDILQNGLSKNGKPIYAVVYDPGKIVFMETGYRATNYFGNCGFEDMSYPDFSLYGDLHKSREEIEKMFKDYHKKRHIVRMHSLISSLTDDENELLAKSRIKGLDYSGTKWEIKD